jgi:hypothetical protein
MTRFAAHLTSARALIASIFPNAILKPIAKNPDITEE